MCIICLPRISTHQVRGTFSEFMRSFIDRLLSERALVYYLKLLALYSFRALGGFALAQHLTRRSLRILCYHGFSQGDEHEVLPWMFMRAEIFERRLAILHKRRFPVIPLDAAVKKFESRAIQKGETVITLDDGWTSNITVALPLLKKYGYPACVYVTTEHLDGRPEAFNVILNYLINRSKARSLTLSDLNPQLDGAYNLGDDRERTLRILVDTIERSVQPHERLQLLSTIAAALELDLNEVLRNDRFRLVNRTEIKSLFHDGVDIQLHTHTHHLPAVDFDSVAREIDLNRKLVRQITGSEPKHFCYPSGLYAPSHPGWLASCGIVSATTCESGLNAPNTSPMLLKRFLDYDDKPDIRFEAEVCGVGELMRRLLDVVGRPFQIRHESRCT